MSLPSINQPRHILFLDGDCVLCQKSATLLHKIDKQKNLYFAPLQGETAKILPNAWRVLMDDNQRATGAVVLTEASNTEKPIHWRGADAILRALYLSGGVFTIFWPLYWLPCWIKSPVYQLIAKHRHHAGIQNRSCLIPDTDMKNHFLP